MKIIASDFDGTLNYNGRISNEDKEAISRFRAKGNKFGVVTGRDVELSSWIRQGDGFEFDFIISCTGAVIRDGEGSFIYIKKGRVDTFFDEMIKKALQLKCGFFAVGDVFTKIYVDVLGKYPCDISMLKEFTHSNCCFPNDELAQEFLEYVQSNFSDKISAYRNGWSVDMPPKDTSKVSGIYEYAKRFDNPEIYTVGDNVNDLPMIKEFCGFAVSNAVDALKKEAKHQCNRICDMIEFLLEEK